MSNLIDLIRRNRETRAKSPPVLPAAGAGVSSLISLISHSPSSIPFDPLSGMFRDDDGGLVHPDWLALPAGMFDDGGSSDGPDPAEPITVLIAAGPARRSEDLRPPWTMPPACVLWHQAGLAGFWRYGPAHALYSSQTTTAQTAARKGTTP